MFSSLQTTFPFYAYQAYELNSIVLYNVYNLCINYPGSPHLVAILQSVTSSLSSVFSIDILVHKGALLIFWLFPPPPTPWVFLFMFRILNYKSQICT